MAESLVRCRIDGDIATVTLDRPAKLNSLTPAMLDELERCARSFDADPAVRVVVLTGPARRPSASARTSTNGPRCSRWTCGGAGCGAGTRCSTSGRGCASR
jgi:1,4-dihydroxy-2-naphthoyl-CoA synthase